MKRDRVASRELLLAASLRLEVDVVNAIARVTGGNFRLIERLFAQIERVLAINDLHTVTAAVVDAARESLVVSRLLHSAGGRKSSHLR